MTALYFTNAKLYTVEAVLPPGGDYKKPDLARFVDSIKFDLSRPDPSVFQPGDTVRFVRISRAEYDDRARAH